jgi:hypothetical protein
MQFDDLNIGKILFFCDYLSEKSAKIAASISTFLLKTKKKFKCNINLQICSRLERFCIGKFQAQKLTRAVVLKEADTY